MTDFQQPLPFRENHFLKALIVWLLVIWILAAIEPINRRDWLLENLLVVFYSILLTFTYRQFTFSNLSYGLFGVFMTLHIIGSHYTYTETPFGFWLQSLFDLSRNHYDRIVHFSFGLLLAYPFREFLVRVVQVRIAWSYLLTVITIIAFSASYEIIEAVVAELVSPELGNLWLGTQGDEWDAQKDSALASCGALLAMLINWGLVRLRS
ncbi:DUF2238 domain-containing protein [Kaarinaea lacus]